MLGCKARTKVDDVELLGRVRREVGIVGPGGQDETACELQSQNRGSITWASTHKNGKWVEKQRPPGFKPLTRVGHVVHIGAIKRECTSDLLWRCPLFYVLNFEPTGCTTNPNR